MTALISDEKFLKLLREQGHIGQSHEKSIQIHVEFKDVQERNYWLSYETECPACGEAFTPVRDMNSHAYGRRKSYVAFGCKGMQCHRSQESSLSKKFLLKYLEEHGPEWRCAPSPETPGIEAEKVYRNDAKPHWGWFRLKKPSTR